MRAMAWLGLAVTALACRHGFAPDAGPAQADAAVIDAAPGDAAPACTFPASGCVGGRSYSCGGACFVTCPGPATRPAAAAVCGDWGGALAQADTAVRADCAAAQLLGPEAYIGGLQAGGAGEVDTGWTWPDGSTFAFTRWNAGEPDDSDTIESGSENCLVLAPSGFWFDGQCDVPFSFVCMR
ncbi:MAG: C-type lectin domain-containing protein [Kofleriaceae bacterium]|jgi:hypothetical protein|nr:C-type lectin domain-containing protein [Kofleriaceae bacterium]